MSDGAVIGVDMTATFALAAALGVNSFVLAELFPALEAALVNRLNDRMAADRDSQITRIDPDV